MLTYLNHKYFPRGSGGLTRVEALSGRTHVSLSEVLSETLFEVFFARKTIRNQFTSEASELSLRSA